MTEPTPHDPHDDFIDEIEAAEQDVIAWMYAERPIPAPTFRGELRRRLTSGPRGGAHTSFGAFSPPSLAANYLGAGVILLAVAAAGLVGAGPFGA